MKITSEDYFGSFIKALRDIQLTSVENRPVDIDEGIESIVAALSSLKNGNKIILIGNGGSASIANHIAVDLWKNGGLKAISFSDSSLLTCVSNDYGFEYVFEKPVEMFADNGDVLIAISSSGKSENILNGVKAAIRKECMVITMSGLGADNPLRSLGELNFYVPSDSYGYVENAHSLLCHLFVDTITDKNFSG
jgi:D-sedoheptulose 7-phosphate isomerase